jgi:hypothetical protein
MQARYAALCSNVVAQERLSPCRPALGLPSGLTVRG